MKLALTNKLLPYETFIFHLADTLNGNAACAPAILGTALAQLNQAGVRYPLAGADGYVTSDTLSAALVRPRPVSSVPGSDGSYNQAVTPTTGL